MRVRGEKEAHQPELTKNMKIFSHKLFLCVRSLSSFIPWVYWVSRVSRIQFFMFNKMCVCVCETKKYEISFRIVVCTVCSMLELGLSGGGGGGWHTTIKRGNRSTFSHSTQTFLEHITPTTILQT